jgi:hypothetical protein
MLSRLKRPSPKQEEAIVEKVLVASVASTFTILLPSLFQVEARHFGCEAATQVPRPQEASLCDGG